MGRWPSSSQEDCPHQKLHRPAHCCGTSSPQEHKKSVSADWLPACHSCPRNIVQASHRLCSAPSLGTPGIRVTLAFLVCHWSTGTLVLLGASHSPGEGCGTIHLKLPLAQTQSLRALGVLSPLRGPPVVTCRAPVLLASRCRPVWGTRARFLLFFCAHKTSP